MMSEDEETAMARVFAVEVRNGAGAMMNLVTELGMNHYNHSRDDELVVLRER